MNFRDQTLYLVTYNLLQQPQNKNTLQWCFSDSTQFQILLSLMSDFFLFLQPIKKPQNKLRGPGPYMRIVLHFQSGIMRSDRVNEAFRASKLILSTWPYTQTNFRSDDKKSFIARKLIRVNKYNCHLQRKRWDLTLKMEDRL